MKRKMVLLFAGALLCLFLAAWAGFLYLKPRQTAAGQQADLVIGAGELYDAFIKSEQQADKQYGNKLLEVTGKVIQVQQTAQGAALLLAAGSNETAGVNCSLYKPGEKLPVAGQQVTVRGRCTGFLADVNLSDAVLVTPE